MSGTINPPQIKTVKAITGYGIIQKSALEMRNLSVNSRLVYSYLCSMTGNNNYCWPTINYMSEKLGICERSVRNSLNELYKVGLIEKSKLNPKSADRRNKYIVLRIDNQDPVDNFKESEALQGQPAPPCRLGTKDKNIDSRPTGTPMPVV